MTATATFRQCSNCAGAGVVRDQWGVMHHCSLCHGSGTAIWLAGSWWAWRQPVNDLSILERRAERIVRLMINVLLLVFAVGSLGGGLVLLARNTDLAGTISDLFGRGSAATLVWFGITAGVYLLYRILRARLSQPIIPFTLTEVPAPAEVPWGQSRRIRDISQVFTVESTTIVERAWQLAFAASSDGVHPLHVADILRSVPAVASMIVRLGSHPDKVHQAITQRLKLLPTSKIPPHLTDPTHELLAKAVFMAAEDRHLQVSPVALFAALAAMNDPARDVLDEAGLDPTTLAQGIAWLRIQEHLRLKVREYSVRAAAKPKGAIDRAYTARATPLLDRLGRDLTRLARDGRLPYVVGREEAVDQLLRTLGGARRSALLIGDSGVGKTTALYALAERMAAEDVPESLQDKRFVVIAAGDLVAGIQSVGDLETRVQGVVNEIGAAGNVLIAIENFDQLVGLSSTGSGALDAANLFLQAMNDGSILGVATANRDAARKFLDQGMVAGTLQRVEIQEMTPDQAITAIESRIGSLEYSQKVYFSYQAIAQAVALSHRYLHEQTLPGKALELLREAAAMAKKAQGPNCLVTGQDVAVVISQQTHTNVADVTTNERQKLLHLEDQIHQRVIGQHEAVAAVANALRRARAELRDTTRPIASLLFIGPTGVGKTELAKTVAAVYFGDEQNMIRLDMSEYQDPGSVNRLIGASSGSGANNAGGVLTEAVRRQGFALVLLDEIEKAHPEILNIFLQVMDDGRLTDNTGRTIDFTNTIIIATSNAETGYIQERLQSGTALAAVKSELMNGRLQQTFRPEFINRFDGIILFSPLTMPDLQQIVGLMLREIAAQLETKNIHFSASPAAIAELAQAGYDPMYGARPMRRVVQERVDNALATYLLQGAIGRRDTAVLEPGGVIRIESPTT